MHYTPPAPTAGLSLLLLMHFTAGRGNGAQASIGGAIGLAGRAVRRLWALNSKGAFASALYRQAADYGPSIGFHSMAGRPDEPSSPALLNTQPFVPLAQNRALAHFMPLVGVEVEQTPRQLRRIAI